MALCVDSPIHTSAQSAPPSNGFTFKGRYPDKSNDRPPLLGFFVALALYHSLTATTMATNSLQLKERDSALSLLNAAIEALNLAKEISSIAPAKAVFGLACVVLAMIRVRSPSLRL